jgi:predicted HicB family RNase H-like nuclease
MKAEKNKIGTITSIDGKRKITVDEFDRIADSGSDEIDQFIDWTKAKRGGARPGSGRKRRNAVRLDVRIRPELHEKLKLKAKQTGVTQVQLVESALEKL